MKKPIKGYEQQYAIDEQGNVYSTPLDGKPSKILKQEIVKRSNTTYRRVALSQNGKVKRFQVHRLVAEAFIPNPDNKSIVNHIDNDGSNNNVTNLEWCTQKENIQHSKNQKRHISDDKEACKEASKSARENSSKKAKEKYDSYIGTTFKNRKLLRIVEYGKHPKGVFECLCCGKEFKASIGDSIKPKNEESLHGCRSCSQKFARRKDIV